MHDARICPLGTSVVTAIRFWVLCTPTMWLVLPQVGEDDTRKFDYMADTKVMCKLLCSSEYRRAANLSNPETNPRLWVAENGQPTFVQAEPSRPRKNLSVTDLYVQGLACHLRLHASTLNYVVMPDIAFYGFD